MTAKRGNNLYSTLTLGICVLLLGWWTGGLDRVMAADSMGREKAEALVAAYAKHAGAHDEVHQTLDENNDRSFGGFGFHYFPDRDVLQARVYIVRSHGKEHPGVIANEQKVDAALNDPKIGGMYDRGGGYFFLDEGKQITFLAKDYKVSTTSASDFICDVDNLTGLAGIWVTNWFGYLCGQIFGWESMPTQFATREHNPYPRQ